MNFVMSIYWQGIGAVFFLAVIGTAVFNIWRGDIEDEAEGWEFEGQRDAVPYTRAESRVLRK